ncbi:MAG: hypothetical protein DIU54_012360 [Acidobacteriota bacterium]|jgi:hypothetical protein|nr:MAG: hypothetical protein DIU54_02990 [Acidobacteriota bacterium]
MPVDGNRPRHPLPDRPLWWQWPTVLSFDAAVVVVAWQWLIARSAGVAIGWMHAAVLGLSVWVAYTADRWIESWRLVNGPVLTARHRFHQQHRWTMLGAMGAALVVDVGLALQYLDEGDLLVGGCLTAAVLAYLLSHQWLHRHASWRAPKEVVIATLLAAGVWLFVRDAGAGRLAWPLGLFWLLCLVNCVLISRWEAPVDRQQGQTSIALQLPRLARFIPAAPWLVAVLAAVVLLLGSPRLVPVAASALGAALLLGIVDRLEPRTGWRPARVAADAALLTPLFWLLS